MLQIDKESPPSCLNSYGTKSMDDYRRYLESTGKSKNTITGYCSDLRNWEREASELNIDTKKLKMNEIEHGLRGRDINTSRRLLASLKSYGRYLNRMDEPNLLMELLKVEYKGTKERIPKSLSSEEYQSLIDRAKELIRVNDRRGIWIGLMINCGLRISEIQNVSIGDGSIRVIGKGNRERAIPCPDWLLDALKVFKISGQGGYLQTRQVVDNGLRKFNYNKFHRMRHTYATRLQQRGVPIEVIQKLLGHSSILTTQIYINTTIPNDILSKL